MNKKGQFYLVAAVIIVLVIVGITSVKTYAITKSEPRKIKDVSAELREETSRIVDYGIYDEKDIPTLIQKFADEDFAPYFLKKTEDTTLTFIYGNSESLYSARYTQANTGTVSATIGGDGVVWETPGTYSEIEDITTKINEDGQIEVNILERDFFFDIKENEMFYFLITQKKDGEVYVERN